ncbi:hypothetical protein [Synechocystis sp. PCC 7509]|uniref:hypothetical protein n=1 Tax=Synechocystis sp. PCC 7509 TaxID=927677 RepID=UPI0002AC2742|nr:hypothetical protein [Synechocystis sp. PCC 7509]
MTYINVPSQGKIEGKFYPLQIEEHMRACRKLTKAQLAIFYYFKAVDPFGGKWIDIKIVELAKQLGLSKITVSRALKFLDQLGWLKLKLISVQVQVQTDLGDRDGTDDQQFLSAIVPDRSNKCDNNILIKNDRIKVSESASNKDSDNNGVKKCFGVIISDQNGSEMIKSDQKCSDVIKNDRMEVLNTAPGKDFKPSKTIKTNKTNKTLSLTDKEREKFLEFARKKASELPKPPTLPEKWIHKNHDELWAKYQELEQRKETNEQQRKESIDKPQETVVDPRIAADLENGKILQIDCHDKMFRDTDGWWQKWHEYEEWNAKRSADSQPTNEELLRSKQLIEAALGIKSS